MTDNTTKAGVMAAAHRTLMAELNTTLPQLLADEVSINLAVELPGRRRFPYVDPAFTIASFGVGAVVVTSVERMSAVERMVSGRSRDELFSIPVMAEIQTFLAAHGQSLAGPSLVNICSRDRFLPAPVPEDVVVELLVGAEIQALYEYPGFERAHSYGESPERPDELAVVAQRDGEIIGIAGASSDSDELWQIGIDIVATERCNGLGRGIVSRLTEAIFDAGVVPYYATWLANIGSRNLAQSLGFWPVWTEIYARDMAS
ncbi:hypothetical protein BH09CHL1_BH09CHL1_28390 [soil metagenome]